jgi:hypothetical protein
MDRKKNIPEHLKTGEAPKKMLENFEEIPPGFLRQMEENKKFIQELAVEDLKESRDTISSERNKIKLERTQTEIQKERFINEMKSGLGEIVKQKPNEIIIIKKPWHHKFTTVIKRILSVV